MAKRKMKYHVKTHKKSNQPESIPSDNYLKNGKAHCPECGKSAIKLVSHYFANPPGPFPPNQAEDRYLKLELRCTACQAAFAEINEKHYQSSTDSEGKKNGIQFEEIKRCPFCGGENLLFDSAAIHFEGNDRYSQKVFCVDCKQHHLEWSVYSFLSLETWDGIDHYEKLHENLKKRQEQLAIQLHNRGQALHTSDAYRLNQQLIDRIRETRLENPPQYDILPDRF